MSVSIGDNCVVDNPGLSEIAKQLADMLTSKGYPCDFVVRAPGRVNLIGEHIDYNGYSVLPMALEQAIHLAVSLNSATTPKSKLILMNTDQGYETAEVDVSDAVRFGSDGPPGQLQWYHYFLSAYHGIADYVEHQDAADSWTPPGMVVLVGGVDFGGLWPAAGLSSSSALVVASALAVSRAANVRIGRRELAGLCAQCERYVGLQGGGMDQTACLLAQKGKAMLIEFTKPLVTSLPVVIPGEVVFVIAHCGVNSRKAATSMYNERVSECRLASKILIRESGNSKEGGIDDQNAAPPCLGDAQLAWGTTSPAGMITAVNGADQNSIVNKVLPAGSVTVRELSDGLALDANEIDTCLTATTKSMNAFRLQDRAQHVYSEAQRVFTFHDLCQRLATGEETVREYVIRALGGLMNDSQSSCAELYQCSCSELDELTAICRSAGALGSRLTGAGWGGCTVSLVPRAQAHQFLDAVRSQYYAARGLDSSLMFISAAGAPASVMPIQHE